MVDKIKIPFIILISFLIFFGAKDVFSASLNMSPKSSSYKEGDNFQVKVLVNSVNTSVNAVSVSINYPFDILSLTSLSKASSIISLWAQEPTFSNSNGTIFLEGVILNGYKGSSGTVITLNFKAKKAGVVNLNFSKASVLANDGLGTEVITGTSGATITINKFVPKTDTKTEPEKEEKTPSKIVEVSKEKIEDIREVEASVNLPRNSLVVFFGVLIILLLIIIIMCIIYYIFRFKKYIRNRLYDTESKIRKNFYNLKRNIKDEILYSKRIDSNNELDKENLKSLIKIEDDIEKSEDEILNEIKEIEKES